jgi:hypothetical protein
MLAAQYSRGLVEKLKGMAPPSLEVFACFWQDSCEHLRQAARSLFHNAALRALPDLLRGPPSRYSHLSKPFLLAVDVRVCADATLEVHRGNVIVGRNV